MKWEMRECIFGDMIRVKLGSIFHYGIYVSDEEVIQFGYPPTLRNLDKDEIKVIVTSIEIFASNQIIEVASPTFFDHGKRYKPELVVEKARARIGEVGYDLISNNCEHFAYECYMGKHYSEQEENTKNKFSNVPFINVYFIYELSNIDLNDEYHQKIDEKVLDNNKIKIAIEHAFSSPIKHIKFKKKLNGTVVSNNVEVRLYKNRSIYALIVANKDYGVYFDKKIILDRELVLKKNMQNLDKNLQKPDIHIKNYVIKHSKDDYENHHKNIGNDTPYSIYLIDDNLYISISGNYSNIVNFYELNDRVLPIKKERIIEL